MTRVHRALTLASAASVTTLSAVSGCMMPKGGESGRNITATRSALCDVHASSHSAPETAPDPESLSVNGERVTAGELWRHVQDEVKAQHEALSPEQYRSYLRQRAAGLITDKIAEMLLHQQARLRLPAGADESLNKMADSEIRTIVTTQHNGIQRRYEKHLEAKGLTLDDVRERIRREIVVASYLEKEVRPRIPEPTRAELVAAYEKSAESLRRPPRRRMSLIEVRIADRLDDNVRNPTREQWKAARAAAQSRIETALVELSSGRSFAVVAGLYSDGLHASQGGSWGWVTEGSVRERFEPAVASLFGIEEHAVSSPVETKDSLFLVRCDEIDTGVAPDFQTLQPQLKDRLFREAYNRRVIQVVSELRQRARIEPANLEALHLAVIRAAPIPPVGSR